MSKVSADPRPNILFLKKIERSLLSARVPSAAAEAEELVRHFLKASRLDFFTGKKTLSSRARISIQNALRTRRRGVPLAQITRSRVFFGYQIFVNEHVLIPRPETEILVEEALKLIPSHPPLKRRRMTSMQPPIQILDIGTGSGCIAVSLTIARPDCRMTALDLSGEALKVARKNFIFRGLGRKVRLVKSDLFSAFGTEKKDFWDMIVSNPPYIPKDEIGRLPREVRSEPASALNGGEKGLEIIVKILEQAPFFLKKNGWLLMEIGAGQSKILKKKISKDTHFKDLNFVKDLNGIDRILAVRKA